MVAVEKIRAAGFTVTLSGNGFEVNPASALTPNQREFLKQHRAEIINELREETSPLSSTDRQTLMSYQASIGEDYRVLIDKWRRCSDFAPIQISKAQELITCQSCSHFQSFNAHGRGAGACGAGVKPYGMCWWFDSLHECNQFVQKAQK